MKRDEILAAAVGVFAQHGFRGSTTRRIADAAGVNEITIFRQFGSKEALIREAMQHMTQSAGLERLPDVPVDPERELTAWSEAFMQHLRLRNSIIRKTMSELEERPEMSECASYVPRQASSDLCAYLAALKREGWVTGKFDPKPGAAMLMGAIFSDAMGRDMMPDVFPQPQEKAAQVYAGLLLLALGVETGAPRTTHKQNKRPKQLSA
ncbi:MAG TPA: helix-turn-helix domain-containing protein [Gemmatimonadaceae bacterium]|jgi:AcrR family transcriptional regulator